MTPVRTAKEADIALLLEGTFPYISGGVSSWVNQLIRAWPDIRFAVIFLGSRPEDYGHIKYELPANVVHLETHYVHAQPTAHATRHHNTPANITAQITQLHQAFRTNDHSLKQHFAQLAGMLQRETISRDFFLHDRQSWDFITNAYRQNSTDPSFIDYFWTIRAMHEPIWILNDIAKHMIPVRAFHTVSTGYAGFLGALLKLKTQRPLLLSEHGIYTKERKIDLFQSNWIHDNRNIFEKDPTETGYFRELWIRFFTSLGRLCYQQSDIITALYDNNRQRQISDGAPAERTLIIPNGIDIDRFALVRAKRPSTPPHVLCLIGRVVAIKDIKTFIRMMRTVVNHLPDAEGWIAGPEDEDPAYAEECRNLTASLGLTENVKFLGFQKMDDLLPKIGLLVLSSISEALPLVILEAFAAGVPALTTDVGACRQLIYGHGDEDQQLGVAGEVTRIADPQAMADAALRLLQPEHWFPAAHAAIQRVERYYTQKQMFDSYRALYDRILA